MKLQVSSGKFGYDLLVKGANRVLDGEEKIRKALKNGIQVYDALVIMDVYEDIQPVFKDGKALANQLKDLDEREAVAVYTEVAAARGTDVDAVEKAVLGSLDLLSDAYDFVKYTVRRGKSLTEKAEALYKTVVK